MAALLIGAGAKMGTITCESCESTFFLRPLKRRSVSRFSTTTGPRVAMHIPTGVVSFDAAGTALSAGVVGDSLAASATVRSTRSN